MFGGCTSCLGMGIIANKLDQRVPINHRVKSYISSTMCAVAVPLTLILFLVHFSFPFSCVVLFAYDLLCLGYYAPVMSMIQGTVPSEQKGAAIGAFGFANNYIQAALSLLIGFVVTKFGLDSSQTSFGIMCACVTSGPSLVAAICFFLAGIPYQEIKLEQEAEGKEAIEAVKKAGVR